MTRIVVGAALVLALLAAFQGTAPGSVGRAQPAGDTEAAFQAALAVVGGVPRAQCGAPVPAGTPCVAPVTDEAQRATLSRGIARFSVTFAEEPGSYVLFLGREPSGNWAYWYATQEQLSQLVSLPGGLLACTGFDGGPARLFLPDRGVAESLPLLTRLTAEEFVLTRPGVPGAGMMLQAPGTGWYRVSAPTSGWVAQRDVTDAMLGDCSLHEMQYGARTSPATGGGGMSITSITWAWQQTSLNNGDVVTPDDPSKYTVAFGEAGRLAGQADCNRAMGGYTITDNRIEIGPLATTRAACPPGSLGDRFVSQLQEAASFFLRDGNLYIELKLDTGTMQFAPLATDEAAVSGVVTYRERIALPPDARIQVQLLDVSRADAPAIVLGEQVIEPAGKQVPIPFSISYQRSAIDPRFRYTIQVRITGADGRLLFITMEAHPVITQGNPTRDIEIVVRPV